MSTHNVEMLVAVRVEVNDPDVIARVVENHDRWQETYYRMDTEDDVIEHLAFNCINNGTTRANALDGWADMSDTAATMDVVDVEPWI